MIATRGQIRAKDGRIEELKAAARALMESCRSQDGLVVYSFCQDPTDESALVVVEAYQNSAAWLGHMASTDFSGFNGLAEVGSFDIYGEEPSPELATALGAVGTFNFYREL